MAAEILAIGTGTANSSDLVVAAGTPVTVCLKTSAAPFPGNSMVSIQLKSDAATYFEVAKLTSSTPALVLYAAGTYRLARIDNGQSCGVFSA